MFGVFASNIAPQFIHHEEPSFFGIAASTLYLFLFGNMTGIKPMSKERASGKSRERLGGGLSGVRRRTDKRPETGRRAVIDCADDVAEPRGGCEAPVSVAVTDDTTNPPGNERAAAEVIANALPRSRLEAGAAGSPARIAPTSLSATRARGRLPPLLLTAHLDVVEADPAQWERPPFSGAEADGCLWGRGAIDMKNMAAMCTAILRRLAASQVPARSRCHLRGGCRRRAGCDLGSRFLVEQHRSKVEAEYAVGESGGFSLHLGDTTFYPSSPIEVAGHVYVLRRLVLLLKNLE